MITQKNTIGHNIIVAAKTWPDKTAFVIDGRSSTYLEYQQAVHSYAKGLIGLGLKHGDHVGILMPNCWDYMVLIDAITSIGAIAVVLNARYRGEDLRYAIAHADVKFLFSTHQGHAHTDLRALLKAAFAGLVDWSYGSKLTLEEAPELQGLVFFDDGAEKHWLGQEGFVALGQDVTDATLEQALGAVKPDDISIIMFSSGTTAMPKACMVNHRMITGVGGDIAARFELTGDDVFWDPLPFYHASSILPINGCRQFGATFVSQAHFEAGEALALMEETKATICYPAFPTIMAALIDHPDFKTRDLSRLRVMLNIGAPELLKKFAAAIPQAVQVSCFGITEGGGVCSINKLSDTLDQRVSTGGHPLRDHKIRIVNPVSLAELPAMQKGEIWVAGPIFNGYYKDVKRTNEALVDGGWCRTGDLGWVDEDGRIVYSGRLKDMLKIGGENVAAVEVESFLLGHPKIKMAQVISAADDRLVEVVAAFIETASGETITEKEIIEFCVGKIASYKIPRYVRFVSDWPMGATKIQKFKLAESFEPTGKINPRDYQ